MYARHKLNTRGYGVMYAAVQDHIADYMRSLSRDDQNFWIHETWDGALHDEQRFRAFVPDAPAREISLELQRFYKTFVPDASTTEWHFLKPAGGAPDQLARRTFLPVPPGPRDQTFVDYADSSIFFITPNWSKLDHTAALRYILRTKRALKISADRTPRHCVCIVPPHFGLTFSFAEVIRIL
jgi:hypothetical protein